MNVFDEIIAYDKCQPTNSGGRVNARFFYQIVPMAATRISLSRAVPVLDFTPDSMVEWNDNEWVEVMGTPAPLRGTPDDPLRYP